MPDFLTIVRRNCRLDQWFSNASRPSSAICRLLNGDPRDAGSGVLEVTATIRAVGSVLAMLFRSVGVPTSNADADFGGAVVAATVSHSGAYDTDSVGQLFVLLSTFSQCTVDKAGVNVTLVGGVVVLSVDQYNRNRMLIPTGKKCCGALLILHRSKWIQIDEPARNIPRN